jgi:hypothetical protein
MNASDVTDEEIMKSILNGDETPTKQKAQNTPPKAPQKHQKRRKKHPTFLFRAYARNQTSRVKKIPISHSTPGGLKPTTKIPLCAGGRMSRDQRNTQAPPLQHRHVSRHEI